MIGYATTHRELAAWGTMPNSGLLLLDLGTPADGVRWDLRRLVAVDSDNPATARAGTVFVCSTWESPTIIPTEIDDLSTAGLPVPFRWSEGTVTLQPGEHVLVYVSVAAGVNVAANAQVKEYPS